MTAAPPPLAADLTAGLRRLKLAAMRRLAPELFLTAKTPAVAPEELLRTLVQAEIHRPGSLQCPHQAQGGRVPGDQDSGGVRPQRLLDPGASWTTSRPWNGSPPPRTCAWSARPAPAKAHLLVALGAAAVQAGHKVRYLTAADLAETLYRGLADDSVGKIIDICCCATT